MRSIVPAHSVMVSVTVPTTSPCLTGAAMLLGRLKVCSVSAAPPSLGSKVIILSVG